MCRRYLREIYYYKDYYLDFFNSVNKEVQKKFNWTLQLIASVDIVPKKYFNHITNSSGLFEIRVEVGTDIYRVFSFFDKGHLIVLINGFQKNHKRLR